MTRKRHQKPSSQEAPRKTLPTCAFCCEERTKEQLIAQTWRNFLVYGCLGCWGENNPLVDDTAVLCD